MPSHYESFGMAAAEAMACGIPVITTNVAGISGLIDEQDEFLITSVNNPLLLASQIGLLLTDSAKHDEISQRVSHKVQNLGWATIATKVIGLYQEAFDRVRALARPKPPRFSGRG
jgi:D-inositol-3-phosphate glycosyltransferase